MAAKIAEYVCFAIARITRGPDRFALPLQGLRELKQLERRRTAAVSARLDGKLASRRAFARPSPKAEGEG